MKFRLRRKVLREKRGRKRASCGDRVIKLVFAAAMVEKEKGVGTLFLGV